MKKILFTLLAFTFVFVMAACQDTPDDEDELITYDVTFDSNGGSDVAAQEIIEGETVSEPDDPDREGFEFSQWELDGSAWDFDTDTVDEDLTLTAAWDEVESPIESVSISSPDLELPEFNNSEDRPMVEIGTEVSLEIDITPENAINADYTVSTSNSRAEADGDTVTFVFGNTGPGRVSILINFDDESIGDNGQLNYRFETERVEAADIETPITEVDVTATDYTLPTVNDDTDRPTIEIGSEITLDVDILPEDASNKAFAINTSNSRAETDGDTVTFVYGNTGYGNVSIEIVFEDPNVGDDGVLNYRFETTEGTFATPIESVDISSPDMTLPTPNDADDRPFVDIGTEITIDVDNILPEDATNKDYTITTSNSRAEEDGDTISFVYGNTGPGYVSVYVTFVDTSVGDNGEFNFRFETQESSD